MKSSFKRTSLPNRCGRNQCKNYNSFNFSYRRNGIGQGPPQPHPDQPTALRQLAHQIRRPSLLPGSNSTLTQIKISLERAAEEDIHARTYKKLRNSFANFKRDHEEQFRALVNMGVARTKCTPTCLRRPTKWSSPKSSWPSQ